MVEDTVSGITALEGTRTFMKENQKSFRRIFGHIPSEITLYIINSIIIQTIS